VSWDGVPFVAAQASVTVTADADARVTGSDPASAYSTTLVTAIGKAQAQTNRGGSVTVGVVIVSP